MKIVTTHRDFSEMMLDLVRHPAIAFDTETTGLDPHSMQLLLCSFASPDESYVLDMTTAPPEWYHGVRQLLMAQHITKVVHNAVFDLKVARRFFADTPRNVYCTLVAEQVLKAGLLQSGFGLADVAQRRLGLTLNKAIRDGFLGRGANDPTGKVQFTADELRYSAQDVEVLLPIYAQQLEECAAEDLQRVFALEMELLPVTADMEYQGICLDLAQMQAAVPIVKDVIRRADRALQRIFLEAGVAEAILFTSGGYTVANTGSVKQVLELFQKMGIEVASLNRKELTEWDAKWSEKQRQRQKQRSDTAVSDEAVNDDDFLISYQHPALRWHAVRTAAAKLLGTYLEGMQQEVNPVTGRLHPGYKQCGAVATGRYSSTKPNIQTMPNHTKLTALGLRDTDIRSMLVAAPGRTFIIADYSGIELVILAAMSGDANLLEQILRGDIHSFVANSLYGEVIEKYTGSRITPASKKADGPWNTLRNAFKPVSYGIVYGSTGWNMFRTCAPVFASFNIPLSPEETDRWVHAWQHELFPGTGKLLQANASSAITRGCTTSVLGRRRRWDLPFIRSQRWAFNAAMREGMNQPIQSSSADMTKLAMVRTQRALDRQRARIAITVHDELVIEADLDYAEEAAALTKEAMEGAGYLLFPSLPAGAIEAQPKFSTCYNK